MTGLEKIHVSCLKEFRQKYWIGEGVYCITKLEPLQNDVFLMSLPKHLPLLRQINISQRMFGSDKEFCKQQVINVQEKFPDLVIETTRYYS